MSPIERKITAAELERALEQMKAAPANDAPLNIVPKHVYVNGVQVDWDRYVASIDPRWFEGSAP